MRRRDDDLLWKEFLKKFLYSFIKLLNKDLYDAIDTAKPYETLDTSLRIPGLRKGKAIYVDFLARVPMLSGGYATILVHVEIQGYSEKISFDKRMFAYFSRLWMKYDSAVTAVALFTGDGQPPRGKYEQECFGTNFAYGYTLKNLDEFDEQVLRMDDSPAALMILAAKLAKACGDDENFKLTCLKELVNLMDERNWNDEDKEYMLLLCEGIVHIEEDETEEKYMEFIRAKEEPEMLVSIIERRAMAQGRIEGEARGEARGKLETAQNMLEMGLSLDVISKATGLSKTELGLQMKPGRKRAPR